MKSAVIVSVVGLLAGCVAEAGQIDRSKIIGHRGEGRLAPENSMPAFRKCLDNGFGFEFDIWMAADGELEGSR